MKKRLTEKHLRRFYRLLSVRMVDFDCGRLCAPENKGIPYCCDSELVAPILYREELAWHRKNGKYWGKMPVKNSTDRKMVKELCSYNVYAECPGPQGCVRSKRSLVCMAFPFEPHLDRDGKVLGLVFIEDGSDDCPLVRKPLRIYNPLYITNAIQFWQELIELVHDEKELYASESRKRERRAKRRGEGVRIITVNKGVKSYRLKV
ncbi:MAG: hypothetical protein JSV71_06405 [Nitrospiraceae bacterium]|nr:MAG: hypothetical protein JSV71_06405 [Nitrospiraceae bacterium]